jgi:DNA-binding NarL/FixJ family response regulator
MDDAVQAAFQSEQADRGRALNHQRWSDYPKTLWEGTTWSESNFLALSEYDGAGAGDIDLVVEPLNQSLSIVRGLDSPVIEAEIMGGLCFTYGLAGRFAESRRHGRDALRTWLRLGYLGQLGFHLAMLARSEMGLGNVVRAVRLAAAGERQHRELGGRRVTYPSWADPMDTAPSMMPAPDQARAVAEGEAMTLDEAVAYALSDRDGVSSGSRARRRDPSELTPREREVLDLLVEGHTDGEIGEALFISPKTASTHVSNIKGKLGADSRVGIVTIALKRGLAEVDA